MILYCYECGRCEKVFEEMKEVEERHTAVCPECGEPAQKKISVSSEDVIFQPRWFHNLAPVPVYIENRDQFTKVANMLGSYSNKPFTKTSVMHDDDIKQPKRSEKRRLIAKLKRGDYGK